MIEEASESLLRHLQLLEENSKLKQKLDDVRMELHLKKLECEELRKFYLGKGESK
jgi:hypothetical protein